MVWRRTLFRSYRTLTLRTLSMSFPSSGISKRAKRPSSTRSGKTSSPVPLVSVHRSATRSGEHRRRQYTTTIRDRAVCTFLHYWIRSFLIIFGPIIAAPNTQSFAHSGSGFASSEYEGPLPNDTGEVVIMSGLQIALSREIGGWPLYTIIIALGQVRIHFLACC